MTSDAVLTRAAYVPSAASAGAPSGPRTPDSADRFDTGDFFKADAPSGIAALLREGRGDRG
ncbi:hypothetical protein AB0H18_26590 [Streptomyces sp. NPDC020766]|uniref:hypothetical protein n=1 Tax=Streptomyces sp. NPDC020766 TaxID=3155011 RepID=UPI0033FF301B